MIGTYPQRKHYASTFIKGKKRAQTDDKDEEDDEQDEDDDVEDGDTPSDEERNGATDLDSDWLPLEAVVGLESVAPVGVAACGAAVAAAIVLQTFLCSGQAFF